MKLIGPLVRAPERNSLSFWRMLWGVLDPPPFYQWKLGPAEKFRAGGFFGA